MASHIEKLIARNTTHGMTYTSEYMSWSAMITRCTNQNSAAYKDYGGRGITVCPQWKCSFEQFFLDMGPKPTRDHQIDRIDNDRGYDPANCCWATRGENMKHTRRSRLVEVDGELASIAYWASLYGVSRKLVTKRISKGMSPKEALTKPKMSASDAAKLGPPARVAKHGK